VHFVGSHNISCFLSQTPDTLFVSLNTVDRATSLIVTLYRFLVLSIFFLQVSGMVTTIRSGLRINHRSIPGRSKYVSPPSVQTGSGIHIILQSMGAGSSVPTRREAGVWKLPCTFPIDAVKRSYDPISSEYLQGVQGHNLTYIPTVKLEVRAE
jgi:hypothetical protein